MKLISALAKFNFLDTNSSLLCNVISFKRKNCRLQNLFHYPLLWRVKWASVNLKVNQTYAFHWRPPWTAGISALARAPPAPLLPARRFSREPATKDYALCSWFHSLLSIFGIPFSDFLHIVTGWLQMHSPFSSALASLSFNIFPLLTLSLCLVFDSNWFGQLIYYWPWFSRKVEQRLTDWPVVRISQSVGSRSRTDRNGWSTCRCPLRLCTSRTSQNTEWMW